MISVSLNDLVIAKKKKFRGTNTVGSSFSSDVKWKWELTLETSHPLLKLPVFFMKTSSGRLNLIAGLKMSEVLPLII